MKGENNITNDKTKEYFDVIASTLGINAGSNADKYAVIRELLKYKGAHGGVLECGGGGGFYTRRLLMDGYVVTCVDLSEKALQENRCQADALGLSDRLSLIHGDFVERVPLLGKQYDQVVFIKVLHHFPSLEAIEAAILAGLQVCKPGGRVVIFEPNGANILWKPFLSLIRDKNSGRTKWFFEQNLRLTTPGNLWRILEKQSYKASIRYHYVLPGFILEKGFWGCSLLRSINRSLERGIFKRCAFNFSLVIDKPE